MDVGLKDFRLKSEEKKQISAFRIFFILTNS